MRSPWGGRCHDQGQWSRPLAGNDHTAVCGWIVAEVLRLRRDERALLARLGVDIVAPSLTEFIGPLETVLPGQHTPRTFHGIALASIGCRDRLGGRTASPSEHEQGNEESGVWWHRSGLSRLALVGFQGRGGADGVQRD